jgi:hypothetical protein
MLPTDWSPPGTIVLGRLSDRRVRQYWDSTHAVARRMAQDARPPQPEQNCCTRDNTLWDLAAVYPPGVRWTDVLPVATFFDGPILYTIDKLETAITRHAS